MPRKKATGDYGEATLAGVKKEMAKPRLAKSARKKYLIHASSVVLTKPRKLPRREPSERRLKGRLSQE
jgi:hypothetical protein